MVQREQAKFYAKKRTRSGRYITIAQGDTREELINKIKSDSDTYKEERRNNVKETHRHNPV